MLMEASGPTARPADTFGAAGLALAVRAENDRKFILAVAEAAAEEARTPPPSEAVVSAPISAPADLAGVMQCIKDHESGNYAESSHPSGASGAYQYMPGTWQTWSERAGYPGYAYAYQAPPEVQDAVTAYALSNGGAGNWSPRYGDDPCTVGMGG